MFASRRARAKHPPLAPAPTLDLLAHPLPGVRRTAILTLAASGPSADYDAALLDRLTSDPDDRARVHIARALATRGCVSARPELWRLYSDPSTPAEIAHAAIVAHDGLEAVAARNDAERGP